MGSKNLVTIISKASWVIYVPNMYELPKGCKFSDRCVYCQRVCQEQEPPLVRVGKGREVLCFFPLWKEE